MCALTQPKYAELIRASCSHLRFIAVTDTDSGEPREDVDEIISSIDAIPFDELPGNKPIDLSRPDPARNLSVQFTSGTTSRPKAVLWTHGNGIWAGKTSAQHYRLREDDITLLHAPLPQRPGLLDAVDPLVRGDHRCPAEVLCVTILADDHGTQCYLGIDDPVCHQSNCRAAST